MSNGPVREFAVAVFVVRDGKVLLLLHPKLGRWLPPGGHVEPNELPDDAAVREVEEETGVCIRLVGGRGVPVDLPRQLVVPAGVQVEPIRPGVEHIDLVYFAVPLEGAHVVNPDCASAVRADWYGPADLDRLGVDEEIRLWCERALTEIPRLSAALREGPPGGILSGEIRPK
jgi:8-oxo-dGTP pyrophosphatase MutT (NUDIX family)